MKSRGQYVVSDVRGEFFLADFSIDGCYYTKDSQWIKSIGILIFRWPGMFETLNQEETEKAIVQWENEAKEMNKDELLKRIETAFPIRRWAKNE